MTQQEAMLLAALRGKPDPAMDAAFAVPKEHLTQMAGDVVPLPITPGPMAGPSWHSGAPSVSQATILKARNHPSTMDLLLTPPSLTGQYMKRFEQRLK